MFLADVNVLVYAFRSDSAFHAQCQPWLEEQMAGDQPFGVSELVLSGFLRVVTHRAIFNPPEPWETAVAFTDALRESEVAMPVSPGLRHWDIFTRLCAAAHARGGLVADAYLAALAIESGCEWVTTDGDFARFPGLRWRRPF
ncbi:MAG: type II toxin-antitoxin system VapC family toxin [Terriglobales bacterium]